MPARSARASSQRYTVTVTRTEVARVEVEASDHFVAMRRGLAAARQNAEQVGFETESEWATASEPLPVRTRRTRKTRTSASPRRPMRRRPGDVVP